MLDIYRAKKKRQPPIKKVGEREICNMATVEGRRIYKERTHAMCTRQRFRCAICKHLNADMEFDHESGRGSGGGNRTDAILDEKGDWINAALCSNCNLWKGSKRYRWVNGVYKPVDRDDPHVSAYTVKELNEALDYSVSPMGLEIRLRGYPCAPEATTARMRDLRKVRYGRHTMRKRIRKGTDYYEYRIFLPAERQEAA